MKNIVTTGTLATFLLLTGCANTGGLDVGRLKYLTNQVLFGSETIDVHDPRVKSEFIKRNNQFYRDLLPSSQQLAWVASLECRNRPDGPTRYSKNGLAWETVVKKGKSSQYLKAYRDDKIIFDYKLANGQLNGWGTHYLDSGEISKMLYKDNHVIKWEHYMADGTLYATGEL